MNKDIEILENSLMKIDKKSFNNAGYIITDLTFQEFQAIESLIQRNKELEEKNKILKNKQTKIIADSFHEKMAKKFDDNFIPKSKVKEKIEELKFIQKRADDIKNGLKIETRMSANKEDRERSKKELEQFEIPELINEYQIKVLQELLED